MSTVKDRFVSTLLQKYFLLRDLNIPIVKAYNELKHIEISLLFAILEADKSTQESAKKSRNFLQSAKGK